jgi:hypothetical protein
MAAEGERVVGSTLPQSTPEGSCRMPNYWYEIELNTPKRLEPLVKKPGELKREVFQIAKDEGALVEHFYIDENRTRAYALVQHHGDPQGLSSELGGPPKAKLLRIEEID